MNIIYLLILITIKCIAIYLILHTISYAAVVFKSSKRRKLAIKNKYLMKDYLNNLIVVVYSHNKEKAAAYMLESLNKQTFSKANCQFHFILDNCTDNTANMLEFIGGAKLWKIGDGITLGKDESISWLLERLINVKNTDAFVFLDVERQIPDDFLENVNKSLFSNDIAIGETEIIVPDASRFSMLTTTLNNYTNRIINTGRTLLGLGSFIDINCFVIKHSVLEKIKYVDFKDTLSPYKYSLLLAKKKYYCTFDPNIKSKVLMKQYFETKEKFITKFSLFVKCLGLFPKCNFKFNELAMHMISPNALFVIILSAFMLIYTYYYYFWLNEWVFRTTTAILLIFYITSLFIAKFNIRESLLMSCSCLSSSILNLTNTQTFTKILKLLHGEKYVPVIKTATRQILVTDGRNSLTCELELINEDGMAKAILKFKKKKYASEYYLRMYDAVNDVVSTLAEHGFRVKICMSCGYFTSLIDGTTNMIKGTCNKCIVDKTAAEPNEVLLWNSCENFIPQEVNKVIDIATFRGNN